MALQDSARIESGVALGRKGVGVDDDEGVFGADFSQRVFER